jgi:hypothetical protein
MFDPISNYVVGDAYHIAANYLKATGRLSGDVASNSIWQGSVLRKAAPHHLRTICSCTGSHQVAQRVHMFSL